MRKLCNKAVELFMIMCILIVRNVEYILIRSNKLQQYAAIIYCKFTLHVSDLRTYSTCFGPSPNVA